MEIPLWFVEFGQQIKGVTVNSQKILVVEDEHSIGEVVCLYRAGLDTSLPTWMMAKQP
jgi:hypothetical protein